MQLAPLRNGKSFLTGLTSREHTNPQFNFLKPTHSMFTFFTSLADAYSKVLMPPKGLLGALKKDQDKVGGCTSYNVQVETQLPYSLQKRLVSSTLEPIK
jgi:hypothetical protein